MSVDPLVQEKQKLDTLYKVASQALKGGKGVLRIPQGYTLGKGVGFVKSETEIRQFLEEVNGIDHAELTKNIMVESYFEHDFSPSITFFVSSKEVTPLTVNYQILENGKFIAATNIIPSKYKRFTGGLLERGTRLATHIQKIGGRGLFGMDIVLNSDTGQEKYVECNYRGTGSTNPELTYQKATNFVNSFGSGNWVFIPFINFDPLRTPDLSAVIETLRGEKLLFEGTNIGTNSPRTVILHGMLPNAYFLSYFWEKGTIPSDEAFATINKSLHQLGFKKTLPSIDYDMLKE